MAQQELRPPGEKETALHPSSTALRSKAFAIILMLEPPTGNRCMGHRSAIPYPIAIIEMVSRDLAMHESHPHAGDGDPSIQEIELAMTEFMQATDTFIASWTNAIRRFANEPAALRQFLETHEAASPRRKDDWTTLAFGTQPAATAFSHPLWDRELDG
jgi:hypothetical protein